MSDAHTPNPLTQTPQGVAMQKAQLAGVLLQSASGRLMAAVSMPQVCAMYRAELERARDAAAEAAASLTELFDAMDAG